MSKELKCQQSRRSGSYLIVLYYTYYTFLCQKTMHVLRSSITDHPFINLHGHICASVYRRIKTFDPRLSEEEDLLVLTSLKQ